MGYIEGITHLLIFYWLPTVHPSSCWIFQMGWNRKNMGCKGLFTHLNVRNHWVGRVIFPFKLGTLHLEVNHHSQMLVLFWMMINSLIVGKNTIKWRVLKPIYKQRVAKDLPKFLVFFSQTPMLTQPILVDVFFLRFKPLPGGLIFWGPPKEGDGKKTSRRKKRSGCAELARARKEGFLALPVSWLEKRGGFQSGSCGKFVGWISAGECARIKCFPRIFFGSRVGCWVSKAHPKHNNCPVCFEGCWNASMKSTWKIIWTLKPISKFQHVPNLAETFMDVYWNVS